MHAKGKAVIRLKIDTPSSSKKNFIQYKPGEIPYFIMLPFFIVCTNMRSLKKHEVSASIEEKIIYINVSSQIRISLPF